VAKKTARPVPRPEYPRPQFVRKDWLCLNGPWQFEIDYADSGLERGLKERPLRDTILVPFAPESTLSGIGHTDFMNVVWYRRDVPIPRAWKDRDVLLHFQAVDYDATVWVNGVEVGRHRGGFTPITCSLEGVAGPGQTATIVVRARDVKGTVGRPSGKQSNHRYANAGCHYTRTTGIWQTVWMEPVPTVRLKRPRITPDVTNSRLAVTQPIVHSRPGTRLRLTLRDSQGKVTGVTVPADRDFTPTVHLDVPARRRRLWSPEDPFLYDLDIELLDPAGTVIDRARSYAGLRGITIDDKAVRLNGKSVFQRMVLDQGFYPDGIWTAPSDAALREDIVLSMKAGFNAARLHQKVFEERFLYHADRMGYLVWGEFGDWGMDREQPQTTYIAQWHEALERDYSHPCIVGWCPLNETAKPMSDSVQGLDDLTLALYLATKAMDATRPVLDASGYSHRVRQTDLYDSHDYDQNPLTFRDRHAPLAQGQPYVNGADPEKKTFWSHPYTGQPYFVSEFGGIWWNPAYAAQDGKQSSWGYGKRPRDIEEFYARFKGLCDVLLADPGMFGYCYTQLTDVFQEQNGIYFFDRRTKFDMKRIRAIQARRAAIED
jgi:beta-galactosidase/beta-glucuronidase